MYSLAYKSSSLGRKLSDGVYKLVSVAEMKACDPSVGYAHFRGGNVIVTGVTRPYLHDMYADQDQSIWSGMWPGGYDVGSWPLSEGYTVSDGMLHNHGTLLYDCQVMGQICWLERFFTLPSGISNPPLEARLWLQNCGTAKYNTSGTAGTSLTQGVIAAVNRTDITNFDFNYGSGDGLQLYFWAVGGTSTATYVLRHDHIYSKNVAAGNSLYLDSGWPKWSGGILTNALSGLPALFANSPQQKVGCRLRWIWSYENISPNGCLYCNGTGSTSSHCSTPVVKFKFAAHPQLYVWG